MEKAEGRRSLEVGAVYGASLEKRVREEIESNNLPRLSSGWSEFQALLGGAVLRQSLLIVKRDRFELAVATDDLLVTLLVDNKHYLVTLVELTHVKGVDLGNHEGSVRKGTEMQLNIWFLDNTRFYWESGLEDTDQIRNFAGYMRSLLGGEPA